ncbi:M55 family metallopeptidase [Paenibacillus cymbidii]|uniref:M55 family metallopeptidase n=1 Tax=Paenibacillus cymbidii TaxID=1639034 RepID=UPI0010810A16|nr:M55 family metallopeptidase [Paenibacillus cymbidii]
MKLYVSADMEGITGIVDASFVTYDQQHYVRGQHLMTGDVNQVLQAAYAHGGREILVNDSHGRMNNIVIEELDPRAQLISGIVKPYCMMQGLDDSCDGALFVGYHARASQKGVLSHTMTGLLKNVYINETLIGEFGFNAYIAGYYNVPVLMVTGDDQIAAEAEALIPGITTAIVKQFVSRVSARCLSPLDSAELLRKKTQIALEHKDRVQPLTPPDEPLLRVEFNGYAQAEWAAFMPGAELETGTTIVRYQAKHILDAYRALLTMIKLSS